MRGPRTEGFPGDSICFKIQTLKVIEKSLDTPPPFPYGKNSESAHNRMSQ